MTKKIVKCNENNTSSNTLWKKNGLGTGSSPWPILRNTLIAGFNTDATCVINPTYTVGSSYMEKGPVSVFACNLNSQYEYLTIHKLIVKSTPSYIRTSHAPLQISSHNTIMKVVLGTWWLSYPVWMVYLCNRIVWVCYASRISYLVILDWWSLLFFMEKYFIY